MSFFSDLLGTVKSTFQIGIKGANAVLKSSLGGTLTITTPDRSGASSSVLNITTGSTSGGTFNSGDINIIPGSPSSGGTGGTVIITSSDGTQALQVLEDGSWYIAGGPLQIGTTVFEVATGNIVVTSGSVTASGLIKGKVLQSTPQAPSFSTTPAIDVSLGDPIDMTLTANVTSMTFTNGVDGQKIILRLRQDGTGSRTLIFGTSVRFCTDIPSITLSTAANKLDYIGIIYNATDSKYDIVSFDRGF